MKKLTALMLAVFLCFSSIPCLAGGANVSIGTASGRTGDTVEIPVILSGNTGFISLSLEIVYDSSALGLVGITPNPDVGGLFSKAQSTSVNPYNFGFDSTQNITYNGTVATVKFTIKAQSGEFPVSISCYKGRDGNYVDGDDTNYDENFKSLGLSYTNGKVSVLPNRSFSVDNYSEPSASKPSSSNPTASEDKNLEFEVSAPENKGYLIAIVYDKDGKMVDMERKTAKGKVKFSVSPLGKKLKILWIENGLLPLASYTEKPINR